MTISSSILCIQTKSEAAPYQQSPDHENRWVTMYIQMSRLNLDKIGKMKMEIFINGRENDGVTTKRIKGDVPGHHNGQVSSNYNHKSLSCKYLL